LTSVESRGTLQHRAIDPNATTTVAPRCCTATLLHPTAASLRRATASCLATTAPLVTCAIASCQVSVLILFTFFNKFVDVVRMYDFKLEGGEWFKEGFRKLLSLE